MLFTNHHHPSPRYIHIKWAPALIHRLPLLPRSQTLARVPAIWFCCMSHCICMHPAIPRLHMSRLIQTPILPSNHYLFPDSKKMHTQVGYDAHFILLLKYLLPDALFDSFGRKFIVPGQWLVTLRNIKVRLESAVSNWEWCRVTEGWHELSLLGGIMYNCRNQ